MPSVLAGIRRVLQMPVGGPDFEKTWWYLVLGVTAIRCIWDFRGSDDPGDLSLVPILVSAMCGVWLLMNDRPLGQMIVGTVANLIGASAGAVAAIFLAVPAIVGGRASVTGGIESIPVLIAFAACGFLLTTLVGWWQWAGRRDVMKQQLDNVRDILRETVRSHAELDEERSAVIAELQAQVAAMRSTASKG